MSIDETMKKFKEIAIIEETKFIHYSHKESIQIKGLNLTEAINAIINIMLVLSSGDKKKVRTILKVIERCLNNDEM